MDSNRFARFPMTKGEVFKLTQPKGCTIKAGNGRLWITQTHHREDIFVEPGGEFVASESGLLIAEALSNTMLTIIYASKGQANQASQAIHANTLGLAAQGA